MNKFIALIFTIGLIVITSLADLSQSQFHKPAEAPTVEIVCDAEKLEFEKSDEAIKCFHGDIADNFSHLSHFDHDKHHTQEYLHKLFKPPKTLPFS